MPGQKEDCHLINHLGRRKGGPGHRVRGGHDLGRKVRRCQTRRNRPGAGCRHPGNQGADRPGRPHGRAPVQARHPARQGQQRAKVQDRRRPLIGAKLMKHRLRHLVLDRDRKQGAKDHVRRRMAGGKLDLGLALGQAGDGGLTRRPDRGEGILHAPAFEGRVDDPALAQPFLAIGHKDRPAQQRGQPLGHATRLREIGGTFVQHAADKGGVVAQIAAKERGPKLGHPRPVQPLGLGRQDVAPKEPQMGEERYLVCARFRLGRGHSTDLCGLSGRVIRLAECFRPRKRSASVNGPAVMRK